MNRMVQSAADIISTTLLDYISKWPSLNSLSDFDQALVDAAVGSDDFRHNLGALQWASDKVIQIASDSQQKMLRIREIDGFLIGGASQNYNKFIDIVKKTII